MKMNEDYMVSMAVTEDGNEASQKDECLILEMTGEDSELLGWKFRVNSIKLEEVEDEAQLSFDYDILIPEENPFGSDEDERITKPLGDAILDLLTKALEEQALKIQDDEKEESAS